MTSTAKFFEQAFPHLAEGLVGDVLVVDAAGFPTIKPGVVTNEGTACGEGKVSDVVKGAIPVAEVDAVLKDFWRKGEIKPLEHWRRLDEVMRNLSTWDGFFEATVTITDGQVAAVDMPPWPTPEELAEVWRGLAEKARQSAGLARAPFPARALCDRPWDISALVEE